MPNFQQISNSEWLNPKYVLVIYIYIYMAVCQNLVPLVNIKIAGTLMFIPLKMVLIGIDPYPYMYQYPYSFSMLKPKRIGFEFAVPIHF